MGPALSGVTAVAAIAGCGGMSAIAGAGEVSAIAGAGEVSAIADVARVRALLIEAAGAGEAVSYAGLLLRLGIRFTRPRMRALCRTLDRIDTDGAAAGEPALAVLVVREMDRLPGQGWWVARATAGYAGPWEGSAARDEVARWQGLAFAHWAA